MPCVCVCYLRHVCAAEPRVVLGNVDVEDNVAFVGGVLDRDAAELHAAAHTHTEHALAIT